MSAAELMADLTRLGIRLEAHGDRLRYWPRSALTPELANRMKHGEIDGYLLKPMNCPHHICIYASEKRSYRDLPVRLAEFGTVYRW